MNKPFKSVEELTKYLLEYNSDESEDENGFDDDIEDPDFAPTDLAHSDDDTEIDAITQPPLAPSPSLECNSAAPSTEDFGQRTKKNIIWKKKKNLQLNEDQLQFHGNDEIDGELLSLETPYQFFCYFFTDELIMNIVEQTNLYSVQKNPEKHNKYAPSDIKKYIAIVVYMSIVHAPSIRSYWSDKLGISFVKDIMPVNAFEKLRQNIHFNDNSSFIPRGQEGHDRLYKIRPLINHLLSKFRSIPLEKQLAIDEQMCSTKVKHFMKQYMPMKPHKWGFKLFVLAGISGFAYNFEIYTGAENNMPRPHDEPDLGATSNIVLRLSRIIPRQQNYRIYHDNFYTAIPLMVYLAKKGIFSLGTVRRNRIPNCKLPTEAAMKKEERGKSHEYMTTIDGVDITSVVWKDNKYVNLISSFAGTSPEILVKRFDRKAGKVVDVKCPNIIQEYNRHMGGVDLLDSLMGRYKIAIKSRKWYLRIFYHLIDMTMVNAWLTYKRVLKQKNKTESDLLNQADFRLEVGRCLSQVKVGTKRGRPSSIEPAIQMKKKRGPAQHVPPKDIRRDETGHWPEHTETKMRCKYPECKGFSRVKCEKCGIALCFNNKNNCFKLFHIN